MSDIYAKLVARAQELEKALEASAAHHHGLLGSYQEVKTMLAAVQPVISAISPQVGAAIETGLHVADAVTDAATSAVNTIASE